MRSSARMPEANMLIRVLAFLYRLVPKLARSMLTFQAADARKRKNSSDGTSGARSVPPVADALAASPHAGEHGFDTGKPAAGIHTDDTYDQLPTNWRIEN